LPNWKAGNVRSAGRAQPEAVDNDKTDRYDQKKKTALIDGASSAHGFQLSDFMSGIDMMEKGP
jgi:hypothetical protein